MANLEKFKKALLALNNGEKVHVMDKNDPLTDIYINYEYINKGQINEAIAFFLQLLDFKGLPVQVCLE